MATAAARQTGGSVRVTLWILLVVYIFNFIDRQIVNILAEPIRLELGLSDTQIGLMTGLAFALFYTILGLPIARFSDRPTTHRPKLIAAALATWSAMTALCGMAQNFVQLLLARIGVGVGEAGGSPPAHSMISDIFPEKERATALIPDELVEDMHIIGTEGEVKEKVAEWESTGVTTLMVSLHSPDEVRRVAELLA